MSTILTTNKPEETPPPFFNSDGISQVDELSFEVKLPMGKDCREWLLEECDWDFDEVVDAELYEFLTIYAPYQTMDELPNSDKDEENSRVDGKNIFRIPSREHYYEQLYKLTNAGKYKIKYAFKEVMGAVEFKLRWVGNYVKI